MPIFVCQSENLLNFVIKNQYFRHDWQFSSFFIKNKIFCSLVMVMAAYSNPSQPSAIILQFAINILSVTELW